MNVEYDKRTTDEARKISVDNAVDLIYTLSAWCHVHGLPSDANTLRAVCSNIEDQDEMELQANAKRPYKVEDHETFAQQCESEGFTVIHYTGRGSYSGPAVISRDPDGQEIIRATTVQVQKDSMGLGSVIYPA